ncbi:nuclear transport factor 2 family protein [Eleftheria terrae]|uniref:nuclear transport factor 2 family protein n=1 Tax=Eleftheria terrae TaxID=1597781 RepID=UPI00263BBC6A|nr:nuclear transport factor 2 family protein [Eleftheria terrae]WKB55704.1 nuclear transport factor 2 family protein [Eleftheria terrae]
MSKELKDKVLQLFRNIDACAWSRLDESFHADVEYQRPGYAPIRGLPELLRFYREVRVIGAGQHVVESVFYGPEGGACSATGSFRGVDRQGRALSVRFCDTYFFQDDKIIRRETFFNAPAV